MSSSSLSLLFLAANALVFIQANPITSEQNESYQPKVEEMYQKLETKNFVLSWNEHTTYDNQNTVTGHTQLTKQGSNSLLILDAILKDQNVTYKSYNLDGVYYEYEESMDKTHCAKTGNTTSFPHDFMQNHLKMVMDCKINPIYENGMIRISPSGERDFFFKQVDNSIEFVKILEHDQQVQSTVDNIQLTFDAEINKNVFALPKECEMDTPTTTMTPTTTTSTVSS